MTRPSVHDVRPMSLYRCYDANGDLIYVGVTVDPRRRMQIHRAQKGSTASLLLQCFMVTHEVDPRVIDGREKALIFESHVIGTEAPLFNAQGSRLPSWQVLRDHYRYIAQNASRIQDVNGSAARLAAYVEQLEALFTCDAPEALTVAQRKAIVMNDMCGGLAS